MEDQYQALYTTYRWWVPQRFNIAEACCRRWTATSADARRIALYAEDAAGKREVWTYARLHEYANRLSNGLRRMGIQRGDRVAIALPQRPETIVAHIAVYQLGAISVPLSVQLNSQLFEQRLRDSEARIALVDSVAAQTLLPAIDHCPLLRQVIGIGLEDERVLSWRTLIARQESAFEMQATAASDPAMLLYTSGASGPPKGVILPHAALIGNLPGFVASQNWFPQVGDLLWTSSEWGSASGLLGALLPSLYFGQAIVGVRHVHTPADTLDILERYRVTHASLTPRSLRWLLKDVAQPAGRYRLALRAITSTETPLGSALFEQCRQAFGVVPNETYGQVEVGAVIGHSAEKWPCRAGSMGRPYPGHQIALVNAHGQTVATGETGEIVVNRYDINGHPDPAFFLAYWRGEELGKPATGTWHHTGDLAYTDEDGYFWYVGRIDEMLLLGTRHLAPGPIEECLRQHPLVADAAVLVTTTPKPALRAYVVLDHNAEIDPDYDLINEPGKAQDLTLSPSADEAATQPAITGNTEPSPPEVSQEAPQAPQAAPTPALTPPDTPLDLAAVQASLLAYAKRELSAGEVPQWIEIVAALPLTATGKIRRPALGQLEEERVRRMQPAPRPPVLLP